MRPRRSDNGIINPAQASLHSAMSSAKPDTNRVAKGVGGVNGGDQRLHCSPGSRNPGAGGTRGSELRPGDILNYYDMCAAEQLGMLQKGMTFRPPPAHGIILMSQRPDAPYDDTLDDDGNLIYEGHDAPRTARDVD